MSEKQQFTPAAVDRRFAGLIASLSLEEPTPISPSSAWKVPSEACHADYPDYAPVVQSAAIPPQHHVHVESPGWATPTYPVPSQLETSGPAIGHIAFQYGFED